MAKRSVALAAAPAVLIAAAVLAACGGSGTSSGSGVAGGSATAVSTVSPSASQTVVTAPPTSLEQPVPTVFDCGGGAYEPKTLIVECGINTTTITGIAWTSWTGTGASGTGTVNLSGSAGHGSGPADLALSAVVQTGNGQQFSRLQVTWTGKSPDGHPSDTFELAVAPG